jgi:hypothetical protein
MTIINEEIYSIYKLINFPAEYIICQNKFYLQTLPVVFKEYLEADRLSILDDLKRKLVSSSDELRNKFQQNDQDLWELIKYQEDSILEFTY